MPHIIPGPASRRDYKKIPDDDVYQKMEETNRSPPLDTEHGIFGKVDRNNDDAGMEKQPDYTPSNPNYQDSPNGGVIYSAPASPSAEDS